MENVVYVDTERLSTRYGHLSKINVTVGQTVNTGDVIGLVGFDRSLDRPALALRVRINNQPVDPKPYLPGAEKQ